MGRKFIYTVNRVAQSGVLRVEDVAARLPARLIARFRINYCQAPTVAKSQVQALLLRCSATPHD